GLIDEGGFAYCENVKNDFDFIEQIFVRNRLNGNGVGFNASLADIATDVHHQKYGQFWSRFPFDVINLDYFGDIFKTNNQNFAVPDFTTIQDIIFHQARSKRQYELWLTMRIKPLRIPAQVKLTFTDLIEENIKNLHFKTAFTKNYPSANKPADLDDEMLYYTGFLKWLYYVCFSSYSIIRNMKVLKYKRNGKDGDDYNIFNILLRIEPYQTAFILSPVGDHVRACKDEYNKGIVNALATPIDVDKEFRELKGSERKRLRQELDSLSNDFFQDEKGWFASAN
ncbi:MAG: hypothetical protein JNK65_03350, partial [Deltaproteobacteria bacterium]|nr:hypothetical protein [Deltaproteobacteria bacterium]